MPDSGSRFNRRAFLEASGFALFVSALEGCGRAPVQYAMAPVDQPEGSTPGRSNLYATVCGGCTAGCGVLVKNRDGRPIKLEGNPEHPLSRGGLCAVGQAAVLSLYDSQRLKKPLVAGKESDWNSVDDPIRKRLENIKADGGSVRVLSQTITSLTRRQAIESFLAEFDDGELVTYDPLSSSAILDAHQQTHGVRVLPQYRFEKADVIVGFDADFLGTWIAPVQYTAAYQTGRVPHGKPAHMSLHVQFESRLSITGGNADIRRAVGPHELGAVLSQIAWRLAKKADLPTGESPAKTSINTKELDELAGQLWHSRERSLVVCGSQDVQVQVLCNYINAILDNYGSTIDVEQPSLQRTGNDSQLTELIDEIEQEKVSALLVAGVNPAYDLPGGEKLAEVFKKVPLLVSFSSQSDETAALADYVCPESHWLEQWGDAEPVSGIVAVQQPAMKPLGDTRSLSESLARWQGESRSDYESIREVWQDELHPRCETEETFQAFWDRTVHDGYATIASTKIAATARTVGEPPTIVANSVEQDSLSLVLYPKVGLADGRHAHNPWLQELPDPISKAAWDNYACLSPTTARRLRVGDGDVIRISTRSNEALEIPVLVQPGQHDSVVAVALGYGRLGTDRFAKIGPQWIEARSTVGPNGLVGVNAAPALDLAEGSLKYGRSEVKIERTGQRRIVARTQRYQSINVPKDLQLPGGKHRPNIEETTLSEFRKDESAGKHVHHESDELWPDDHPYTGHHWGLIVDLNKCTGCSACVISCQAENNVPVVGRDEVRRHREMHWIRIDRYYNEQKHDLDVLFQPMMCHHCDHAPCETVCPVIATAHSDEGLNQQVYNRCVGTRYCANNCPYKVRRFNWFTYAHPDEVQNLALNPDVTVRTRGVMEKCSFCVQRIQEAKLEAKRRGEPLADGDVQPACQQSCPAGAIVFGDLNDPESAVAKASKSGRSYQVLSEMNFRPTVGYLRVVRNRETGERTSHHV